MVIKLKSNKGWLLTNQYEISSFVLKVLHMMDLPYIVLVHVGAVVGTFDLEGQSSGYYPVQYGTIYFPITPIILLQ